MTVEKTLIVVGATGAILFGALCAWYYATKVEAPVEEPQGTVEMTMEPAELAEADVILQRDVFIPANLILGIVAEEWKPQTDALAIPGCTARAGAGLWGAEDVAPLFVAHYAGISVDVNATEEPVPVANECQRGTMFVAPAAYVFSGDATLLAEHAEAIAAKVTEERAFLGESLSEIREWAEVPAGAPAPTGDAK